MEFIKKEAGLHVDKASMTHQIASTGRSQPPAGRDGSFPATARISSRLQRIPKSIFAPPNVLVLWQVMICTSTGLLARAKRHRHARHLPQGSIVCLCGMQGVHGWIRDDPKLGSLDNLWVYRCSEFL